MWLDTQFLMRRNKSHTTCVMSSVMYVSYTFFGASFSNTFALTNSHKEQATGGIRADV